MEHKFKVGGRRYLKGGKIYTVLACGGEFISVDDDKRADMDDRDMVQGDWVFERFELVQEAAQDSDDPQHNVVMVSTDVDAGAPASEQEDIGSAATSKHYNEQAIQPIELMQLSLSPEEFRGFLKGNIMKYSMRAGSKAGESVFKDTVKAKQYKMWLDLVEQGVKIDPRTHVVIKGQ